jgi:hypothetical protein
MVNVFGFCSVRSKDPNGRATAWHPNNLKQIGQIEMVSDDPSKVHAVMTMCAPQNVMMPCKHAFASRDGYTCSKCTYVFCFTNGHCNESVTKPQNWRKSRADDIQ